MKVSEVIANFIASKGIDKVFLLTGGGIMHLTDSIGKHPDIEYVCNYHEQACAIAAEGYARVTGKPGVFFATTGPGIANALSGAIGAWHDSIPLLMFAGQVRTTTLADYTKIRQYGPQEGNIIDISKPMTKYAISIRDPKMIIYELEKAYYHATSGRPGPVLIEVPLDIQSAEVAESELISFPLPKIAKNISINDQVTEVIEMIRNSKRPVLFPGNGIRLSNSYDLWIEFLNLIKIPVVIPYCAKDLIPEDHSMNMGVVGTNGQRRANFTVQNADCFLSLASGISISKIGFNPSGFAPKAKKIILDIDEGQLYNQAVKADLYIKIDIKKFLQLAIDELKQQPYISDKKWIDTCAYWKNKYNLIVDEYFADKEHVNMYVFSDRISNYLNNQETVVSGNGFDAASIYQVFKPKTGQRVLIPGNWGAMGWDLPTAVGASCANPKITTVLITGDGSIMLNIQELLTINAYKLPIKIFIFNNQGYASIRATQNNLLNGNLVGSDFKTGILNPDFEHLAMAFNLKYIKITNNNELDNSFKQVFADNSPYLCEVNLNYEITITPKAIAFKKEDGTIESKPLEDMFPFLPKEEIEYNMTMAN